MCALLSLPHAQLTVHSPYTFAPLHCRHLPVQRTQSGAARSGAALVHGLSAAQGLQATAYGHLAKIRFGRQQSPTPRSPSLSNYSCFDSPCSSEPAAPTAPEAGAQTAQTVPFYRSAERPHKRACKPLRARLWLWLQLRLIERARKSAGGAGSTNASASLLVFGIGREVLTGKQMHRIGAGGAAQCTPAATVGTEALHRKSCMHSWWGEGFGSHWSGHASVLPQPNRPLPTSPCTLHPCGNGPHLPYRVACE